MKNKLITAVTITGALMSGCATHSVSTFETFQAEDLSAAVQSGQYQQKADNFFVINDSSSSMADDYLGAGFPGQPAPTKHSVEKEILNRMNQTIPDLRLTSSIRSFGFGPCLSWGSTQLNQAPTTYTKSSFGQGIDSLTCASGGSPMASGIDGTAADLAGTSGNIAVLILSDGHDLDSDPVAAVKSLKQQYGDRLCVYPVWVGNEEEKYGITVLNKLSNIAGCGFTTLAENIASADGMATFVKSVFLKTSAPVIGDEDGDGVLDDADRCPGTPKGAHVNSVGCWIIEGVKFDTDKSDIKPEYFGELDQVISVIRNNPGLKIEVQGHTDNVGSAAYNQRLSERRAQAVANYLSSGVQTYGTLSAHGYGLTRPIDSNDSPEGRANNRRVQLDILR
jgi:OOP family OmpA-OmpF porin